MIDHSEIEAELRRFEAEERRRLGLPPDEGAERPAQWRDRVDARFTAEERAHTTLLVCGLTMAHDLFCQSALRGLGYDVRALDVPDDEALQYGKEYGNRAQCNPTYYTVGNLVKHLKKLEASGLSKQEIIDGNIFLTAGACGPCRFGTYVTEYRKALRDAGFEGFRVLLFQQTGGLKQATGEDAGLKMDPPFFIAILKAIVLGDVLNALGYRIRPYEVEAGATDRAIEKCKEWIAGALATRAWLGPVLWRCRRELGRVKVDRTRIKPKVSIIGEFWAMTTEGDGNYKLQRFLEREGAEVDIQLVSAWLLYNIWATRYDTERRAELRGVDGGRYGLAGIDVRKRLLTLAAADLALRSFFQAIANALGLHGYHLPDMDEVAAVSHAFYDVNLRGGEGHMEVGKLILNIAKSKVNMTLSVKPFGCMPSSSVSDGVQSLVQAMYPRGIFLPIETSGDGAVNVQSRIQMQLFKAKQAARKEVDDALAETKLTMEEVRAHVAKDPALAQAFHKSPHRAGCTAADLVYEVAARRRPKIVVAAETLRGVLTSGLHLVRRGGATGNRHSNGNGHGHGDGATEKLAEIARAAAAKTADERMRREAAEKPGPHPADAPHRTAPIAATAAPPGLKKLPLAR
jgi:predicted nucleotide-binding protein (sugar kinase/HSP70/actin superfamily)